MQFFAGLQKTFPNVHSVAKLPSNIFSLCFHTFVEAVEKYEQYKQKLEESTQKSEL